MVSAITNLPVEGTLIQKISITSGGAILVEKSSPENENSMHSTKQPKGSMKISRRNPCSPFLVSVIALTVIK